MSPSRLILTIALAAGLLGTLPLSAQTGVDPAYAAGYSTAYRLGRADHAAGRAANPHKFSAYQLASAGYNAADGSCADYRAGFQSGFADGYGDGYARRAASVTAPPPPPASASCADASADAPAAPAASSGAGSQVGTANGYQEGYDLGQTDANAGHPYDLTGHAVYNSAQAGYVPALGSLSSYQSAFQDGFALGYDAGFHRKLFDSSIGGRQAPDTASPAPVNAPADPAGSLLIPQGTTIQGTLNQALSTKTGQAGETFALTVTVPVYVGSTVAIPSGATIQGTIASLQRGGHFGGHADMNLRYDTLTLPGQTAIDLSAETIGVGTAAMSKNEEGTITGGNTHKAADALKGGAAGAGIGALIGGGKGAADGAAYGALGATLAEIMMHNRDITLPAGTVLQIRLDHPLPVPAH